MNKVSSDQAHNFHTAFQLQNGILHLSFLIFFLISFVQQKKKKKKPFASPLEANLLFCCEICGRPPTVSLSLKPTPINLTVYKTLISRYEKIPQTKMSK